MQDQSGAHPVAPEGSRLRSMPATSGGSATTPRAPGQDRPRTVPPGTVRPDRPCATPQAPGYGVPQSTSVWAPDHNRPRAARQVSAACRPYPAQRAPGQERPHIVPIGAVRPDRPRATLEAPDQDVPWATLAQAPGADRPRAVVAIAAAADASHVLPPAPGPDRSRRVPTAGPRPTLVTPPTPPHQEHDPCLCRTPNQAAAALS